MFVLHVSPTLNLKSHVHVRKGRLLEDILSGCQQPIQLWWVVFGCSIALVLELGIETRFQLPNIVTLQQVTSERAYLGSKITAGCSISTTDVIRRDVIRLSKQELGKREKGIEVLSQKLRVKR